MSLEPDYPAALLQDLLERIRAALVVTDDVNRTALHGIAAPVMGTAGWAGALDRRDESDLPLRATPDNLAHVFFTSGSTGRPKGLHRASPARRLSRALSLDAHGAGRHLPAVHLRHVRPRRRGSVGTADQRRRCAIAPDGLDDPPRLAQWIAAHRVTMAFLSASVFNTVIDEAPEMLAPMRKIVIGGEALSVTHIRRALELLPPTELINGYAPTETTIYYTGYSIPRPFDPAAASVPIGKPLDNGCVYIVDRNGQLLPDGLPGELWIGGDTVGRGYLHDAESTAAAFVPSPVAGGARVYRTGDRARWRLDGEIEFLGRVDQQVKYAVSASSSAKLKRCCASIPPFDTRVSSRCRIQAPATCCPDLSSCSLTGAPRRRTCVPI